MADAARGFRTAAKGFQAGTAAGSFIPVVGNVLGGLLGGAGGALYDFLGGNAHKEVQAPLGAKNNPSPSRSNTMAQTQPRGGLFDRTPGQAIPNATPEQQQLQNQSISQALGLLNGRGGLNPIAQQSINRFKTETVPSLAERFTAMGSNAAPGRQPAFAATLGQAAAGLETDLAAQQYGLLALLSAMGNRNENVYRPEQPGFAENAGKAALEYAPNFLDQLFKYLSSRQSAGTQESSPFKFPDINSGYQLGGNPLSSESFSGGGYSNQYGFDKYLGQLNGNSSGQTMNELSQIIKALGGM